MKGMRLVGPQKMINMPAGTIFIKYWMRNSAELKEVVDEFLNNSLEIQWRDVCIYYDNSASWSNAVDEEPLDDEDELDDDDDNDIWLIDINIVGDADPENTIYLIIENGNLIPQPIRDKVLKYRKFIIKDNNAETPPVWALESLNNSNGEYIDLDLKGE